MDTTLLDSFARFAPDRSRRGVLARSGLAAGGLAALLGSAGIGAKKKGKKNKKNEKKSGPPALAYACAGPPESVGTYHNIVRVAQVFQATRGGALRRIEFLIDNEDSDSGDYVVQLLRVDNGTPQHAATQILAATTIPEGAVPTGETTLAATFAGPRMESGTEYAAAIGRLGSPVRLGFFSGTGNACAGQTFASQGGAFTGADGQDLVVSVFVA